MTLSTTDVSEADNQWACTKLDVEELLVQGEHFLYYLARVLDWL